MESANEQGVIYINQYCPFESVVCGGKTKILCSDGYLSGGKVTFTIDSKIPLMLNIRIPSFAGKNAKIDGIFQITPGAFSTLNVNPGITEIHADFDFSPVLHDNDDTYEDYSDKDFRIERWLWEPIGTPHANRDSMMKKQCSYITYGPLLLAQSKKLGASEKDMFDFSSVHGKNYKISAELDKEIPKNVFLNFKVTLDNGKDKIEKRMCDYASASDSYSNLDDKFFNVYL